MKKEKTGKNGRTGRELQNLQIKIIILYVAVAILTVGVIVGVTLEKTKSALNDKVGGLSAMVNSQMTLNLQNYLDNIEENGTFIFTEKAYYTYTAEETAMTDYEHFARRKEITARLQEISLMESYSDFGILYKNGVSVGKISEGTTSLYGSDIFSILMDVVQDNAAEDGWTIGYKGNYDRLYYVKKLNDSAIMVSAIYTSELADVFEKADRMEDMTIALIDQGEHMMYSSETSEIGNKIDVNIAKNLKANVSETVINREYLISEDTCENWRVICYIPTSSVMAEYSQLQMYILIISGIVIFLTLTIGIRLSSVVAHPISDMVKSLDKKASTDLLTLVLNKKSFEEQSENLLLNAAGSHYYAFMIIDVDDFKKVNDTNGHAFGDKVLENIAEMLRGTFWKNCLIGRLGGDEFAVLMSIPEEKNAEAKAYVDELVRYLYDRLSGWNRNYNDTAITLSSGIVLNQKQDDFKTIYKNADYALYQVKREGKNRFFIWDREESGTNDK